MFPDPHGRHESRWWDGATWTCHVADRGLLGLDEASGLPPVALLRSPTLVFHDLAPGVVGSALDITDPEGRLLGFVRRMPGSTSRILGPGDVISTVHDVGGLPLLTHVSPVATARNRTFVEDPNRALLGDFRRAGMTSETTQVVVGGLLVAHFQTMAPRTPVVDVNESPVAMVGYDREPNPEGSAFRRHRELWFLRVEASVSWPLYLMLVAAPIESKVRKARRDYTVNHMGSAGI